MVICTTWLRTRHRTICNLWCSFWPVSILLLSVGCVIIILKVRLLYLENLYGDGFRSIPITRLRGRLLSSLRPCCSPHHQYITISPNDSHSGLSHSRYGTIDRASFCWHEPARMLCDLSSYFHSHRNTSWPSPDTSEIRMAFQLCGLYEYARSLHLVNELIVVK